MSTALTPEILAELKARHLAFLEARLVSDAAAAEWRENLAAVHATLLATRVGNLIDGPALADAIEAALTRAAVEEAARPLAKRLIPFVRAALQAEKGKVKERVPASAQQKIDQLIARPGLMPERLLREVAEQDAIDEMMRDVLYDGFKEFSEKVNPFTAEWGIPSLLKRMSLLGGAMTKGLDTVKAEFDRRLEPELRRFLASFSKRGLRRMVDVTIARADQPASIAVRKHLVAWVMEQELAALARDADEEAIRLLAEIGLDVAAAEVAREEGKARNRTMVLAAFEAVKDKTVAEALAELGVTYRVDTDALAAASWPAAKVVLGSAPVKGWLGKVVGEFYDGEMAKGGA
jgi:hypothetical protein